MFQMSKLSSVGAVVVVLFGIGCGQPSQVVEMGEGVDVSAGCTDNPAFDVYGIFRATGEFPAAMACADFNGDGQADLAVASAARGVVSVFLGQDDGTVSAQSAFPVDDDTDGSGLTARDTNADGWVDLVVTNEAGETVTLLQGHGPGGFSLAADSEN